MSRVSTGSTLSGFPVRFGLHLSGHFSAYAHSRFFSLIEMMFPKAKDVPQCNTARVALRKYLTTGAAPTEVKHKKAGWLLLPGKALRGRSRSNNTKWRIVWMYGSRFYCGQAQLPNGHLNVFFK